MGWFPVPFDGSAGAHRSDCCWRLFANSTDLRVFKGGFSGANSFYLRGGIGPLMELRFYNCVKRRRGLMGRAVAVVQRCISRRGALAGTALLAAAAIAGFPATAAAEGLPDEPYAAWSGYASTAPVSVVPGCVPVSAPLSGGVAWRVAAAADGPLALRQVGSSARLYALAAGSIVAVDMVTGERLAQAELPAPTPSRSAMLFIDSALAVPCADGSVALYTEDLERIAVSPSTLGGAAGDGAAVATDGAVLYAAFPCAGRVRVAGFSAYDAQELWSVDCGEALDEASPTLVALSRGVLVADGGAIVRLLSADDGSELSSFDAGCAVGARVAPVYGGHDDGAEEPAPRFADAVLVGTEAGRVSLLRDRGALAEDARVDVGRALADRAPVAASRGGAWAADGAFIALDMRLSGDSACLDMVGEVPAAGPVPSCGVAVCRGLDASTAEVTVYAAAEDGLRAVERSADGGLSVRTVCDAATIGGAPTSGATIAPLVDRDGTLVLVGASGDIVALEADASRAVAMDVGGHEGLDTVGRSLAGVVLPNGAGIGAGALVLGATFAAYAFIRNRGGARDRDEGLDAWRAQHGGGDGAEGSDRRGRRR